MTEDMGVLRGRNVAAIREMRRLHVTEWSDPRGYDMVVVPKVCMGQEWKVGTMDGEN